MIDAILMMFIGLAGGIVVGGGLVALLTVLAIVPRLIQLSRMKQTVWCESALVIGALTGTWLGFLDGGRVTFAGPLFAVLWGGLAGVFVGMLAAALTEVLNILPLLSRRIGLANALGWLLAAIALGKVCGSLVDWLWI